MKPRSKLPPLLTPLGDLKSEKLHWLGVSFGLTSQLLNFWSRKLFKVCYRSLLLYGLRVNVMSYCYVDFLLF